MIDVVAELWPSKFFLKLGRIVWFQLTLDPVQQLGSILRFERSPILRWHEFEIDLFLHLIQQIKEFLLRLMVQTVQSNLLFGNGLVVAIEACPFDQALHLGRDFTELRQRFLLVGRSQKADSATISQDYCGEE